MPEAPLPDNEVDRMKALKRYSILDTEKSYSFDRVTRLAARMINVPIALVSFVDTSRQWFKAHYGIEFRETAREYSFCAYAILDDGITLVENAADDERFKDNPLVTGDTAIRAYAGAPLKTPDGFRLGTLCILDTRPRQFDENELEVLGDLAAYVEALLELRYAEIERVRHEVIVNNLDAGIVLTDPGEDDNPITYVNPAFCQITGYTANDIVGLNCRVLQGNETDRAVIQDIRRAIDERQKFHNEVLNYRKDETPFWNELIVSPVFDDEGNVINYVGLQKDITERKRLRDELAANYQRLRELENIRDNLTAMIVHDLRSPLSVVMGYLDILQAEMTDSDHLECVERARDSATTLNKMITSLLDITRLEAGEMPLDMVELDLVPLIRDLISGFRAVAGTRSLSFTSHEAELRVMADQAIAERVISNLINNALKFTGPAGEIAISLRPVNEGILVSVADDGNGIPDAYKDRIFDKFAQVKDAQRPHSTGLGLTFCKLAVEAQGGQIGVESTEGEGSTFWFSLKRPD